MGWKTTRSGRAMKSIATNDLGGNTIVMRFRNSIIAEFQRIKGNASGQKIEILSLMNNNSSQSYSKLQSIYRNIDLEDMLKYDDAVILMCEEALSNIDNVEKYLDQEVPWKLRVAVREKMLTKILKSSMIKLNRLQLTEGNPNGK